MTSAILNITVDCRDPRSLAEFWAAVTGRTATGDGPPENPYWLVSAPDGAWPRLVFVPVPEPATTKNRWHLDVVPDGRSQAAEVDRLVGLGATVVDDSRAPGGWIVMADPEGNLFCVEPLAS